MKPRLNLPVMLPLAGLLSATSVQASDNTADESASYPPLLAPRPVSLSVQQPDQRGAIQLGIEYNDDDSFMAGRYNGRAQEDAQVIGNLHWQHIASDSYWRVDLSDLGTDVREGTVTWGKGDRLRIELGFDSQRQVNNDSGRSPFLGGSDLVLPNNWISAPVTSGFTALADAVQPVRQSRERETVTVGLAYRFNSRWQLDSHLSHEQRDGIAASGAGIYIDAATADAVILPEVIDHETTEFDIGLSYSGKSLHLKGTLDYSDFDNQDTRQTWQNPYSGYGPAVRYPNGIGGLALAPDNEQVRGRLTGHYIASPTARVQFDGSYALLRQDQAFADYTVNPSLLQGVLPREDLNGEVAIGTFNVALQWRPASRWQMKVYVDVRDRDYKVPRDGYHYNRGDATATPREALTVYNTAHDYQSETLGMDINWRLPRRSRLSLDYALERITRRNAAVEETEEDQYALAYRLQPMDTLTLKLEGRYQDRRADTYAWDQRYFALLDNGLINATPQNQRYLNHPELSQYHLSNRERTEASLEATWQPVDRWHIIGNLRWREDQFDQTILGLNDTDWRRADVSASYAATNALNATLYASFDRYASDQTGKAFRGGLDKNAFAIFTPLPQASDPDRDWQVAARDDALTVGANVQWQVSDHITLATDYNFVDTVSRQHYQSVGLAVENLPDVDTRLHHFNARGTWQQNAQLAWQLDYQYYRYKSNDYQYTGSLTSIDKVLTLGQSNPSETVHYMGVSAIYRWQ